MNWASLTFWDAALVAAAFLAGAAIVRQHQRKPGRARLSGASPANGPAIQRPATQIPVRQANDLIKFTRTGDLLRSIEQRMRFSAAQFERDCWPVLECFAVFVQALPASECHHHAQPGGLLIHVLEVVDAALTFRAGIELPSGASTEDRKRLEHRWTYAVFTAALLHDVGKPVTDLRVSMYSEDPRAGRPWAPLAGAMTTHGAQFYTVSFTDPTEKDYLAHQKLAAMLLHQFVPARLMRWLSEDGDVLTQLLAYLAGEAADGELATIVKRADSDSVRRNLLHGPRTRFATARTRPLIERLMEALRRMLQEGAALPLNRPGAAGWIFDGCAWFVCARLADDVRNYLTENESGKGIPGKDRNDRLFDTWQEHGAVRPAADGGAIWRVRVECDTWKSPDALTVLCFGLDKLYQDPKSYPSTMTGRIIVEQQGAGPSPSHQQAGSPGQAPKPAPSPSPLAGTSTTPAAPPAQSALPTSPVPVAPPSMAAAPGGALPVQKPTPQPAAAPAAATVQTPAKASQTTTARAQAPAPQGFSAVLRVLASAAEQSASAQVPPNGRPAAPPISPAAEARAPSEQPADALPAADQPPSTHPAVPVKAAPAGSASYAHKASKAQPEHSQAPKPPRSDAADILSLEESARLIEPTSVLPAMPAGSAAAMKLGAPMRPHQGEQPRPQKEVSPAAEGLMAWVAHAVSNGQLKYNQEGAVVHFVPEGCLLLSPEVFRQFLAVHEAMAEGPVADLRATHGDRAFARLQNELAKSGWTQRNGDENLHHYAFVKADGQLSRPASFFLLPQPQLFWNPVPRPNERIRKVQKAKKLAVPSKAPARS